MNFCLSCGYNLGRMPYANIPNDPSLFLRLHEFTPPYYRYWGEASYAVCPCCGFEFGADDNNPEVYSYSFQEYFEKWVESGMKWCSPKYKPLDWDLAKQRAVAGFLPQLTGSR